MFVGKDKLPGVVGIRLVSYLSIKGSPLYWKPFQRCISNQLNLIIITINYWYEIIRDNVRESFNYFFGELIHMIHLSKLLMGMFVP